MFLKAASAGVDALAMRSPAREKHPTVPVLPVTAFRANVPGRHAQAVDIPSTTA